MPFTNRLMALAAAGAMVLSLATAASAESYKDIVGDFKVGDVSSTDTLEVPFITWGGDVATFHANGGLKTKDDSIFGKADLNLNLRAGDDFPEQVRRYMAGDTPFLRGTMRMVGLASEVLNSDERTEPVVFLQLTWSAGDHVVARKGIDSLNDLKGKKVVLQKAGPHVGLLADALAQAKLSFDDVTIVYTDELTGDNGPAAMFKKDDSIDVALVISPDMVTLTGGLESTGDGSGGTVDGASVLVSTASLSRSIADVYVVRSDFYKANRELVEKFTAGYLKGTEELMAGKAAFEASKNNDARKAYMAALGLARDIFGKDVLPTLEADAHGLVSDAEFVGLTGNVAFFTEKGNLVGFDAKADAAVQLAVDEGYASKKTTLKKAEWDYDGIKKAGSLRAAAKVEQRERFAELSGGELFPEPEKAKEITFVSLSIMFDPNQSDFSADRYGDDFEQAIRQAASFGNAVIAVGGHADPALFIQNVYKAGLADGTLERKEENGSVTILRDGKPFDMGDTAMLIKAVEGGDFKSQESSPATTLRLARELSEERARAVRQAILDYAKAKGLKIDASQIQAVGVGIREPVESLPRTAEQAAKNRRVEFRVVRVPAEAIKAVEFDF